MSDFTVAVNSNGVKQRIPTAWLTHPILGSQFRLPPSARGTTGQNVATPGSHTTRPTKGRRTPPRAGRSR